MHKVNQQTVKTTAKQQKMQKPCM